MDEGSEIQARHQRAGYLWKLPMSKPGLLKWQKRMFIAKDGFLLYYDEKANPNAKYFDTKPRGIIPLGGSKVELVEQGPKGSSFGLKISHPDFIAGRSLILAAESEESQKAWLQALTDCSRVTMENALLGDSMIEKLRSVGTAMEAEKEEIMQKLQEQALALKLETEEKLSIIAAQEEVIMSAKEAEERAVAKEAELAAAMEDLEARRRELDEQQALLQGRIAERNDALAAAQSELSNVQGILSAAKLAAKDQTSSASVSSKTGIAAAAGLSLEELQAMERRALQLEEEKLRLEREKKDLEKSVRDMVSSTDAMRNQLLSAEQSKQRLESQLMSLRSEEGDLKAERKLRKNLEKRLQAAENALRRLDAGLKKEGIKLDMELYVDVKTLMGFFEDKIAEVQRDSTRIQGMKEALRAKKKFLLAHAKVDGVDHEEQENDDDDDDDEEENHSHNTSNNLSVTENGDATLSQNEPEDRIPSPVFQDGVKIEFGDEFGRLPNGWTKQTDDTGDSWFYCSETGETSWNRPNPDGTMA